MSVYHIRRKRNNKEMPKPKNREEAVGAGNIRSTTRGNGRPLPRPHETEEEAIIRRFHDAQRMARFRAKRKKAMEETRALEASKLSDIAVSSDIGKRYEISQVAKSIVAVPSPRTTQSVPPGSIERNSTISVPSVTGQSKYSQLLCIIEELGRDIRLTYGGSRTSNERLKIGIARAKRLVKDCLLETEISFKK